MNQNDTPRGTHALFASRLRGATQLLPLPHTLQVSHGVKADQHGGGGWQFASTRTRWGESHLRSFRTVKRLMELVVGINATANWSTMVRHYASCWEPIVLRVRRRPTVALRRMCGPANLVRLVLRPPTLRTPYTASIILNVARRVDRWGLPARRCLR